MEQKDKTRKEELLERFEHYLEQKQAKVKGLKDDSNSLPFDYLVEKRNAILGVILPEYHNEVEKAFESVPSRESVGEQQWEKAFMAVLKERIADTNAFLKKIDDVDQKFLDASNFHSHITFPSNHVRNAFAGHLFRIAKKHDTDPVRSSLSDVHIYFVKLRAELDNRKTPANTEPAKTTGEKMPDAAKPSRPTGRSHKNNPKTLGR